MDKEKKSLFIIKDLPFDNTYYARTRTYLFIPGRYTEVYGEEDIAFFRAKKQCTEKTVAEVIADKIVGDVSKRKSKDKGAKAEKEDKKAKAEKKKEKEDKPELKPGEKVKSSDENPLDIYVS